MEGVFRVRLENIISGTGLHLASVDGKEYRRM